MGWGAAFGMSGTSSSSSTAPWAPQATEITSWLYPQLNALWGRGAYSGPYTAGINPMQTGAIDTGYGAANNAVGAGATLGGWGNTLAPATLGAAGFASGVVGGDTGFSNPYTSPDYISNIQNIRAGMQPLVDQQIAGSLVDPYRQLTEQTLPGGKVAAAQAGQFYGGSQPDRFQYQAGRDFADRAAMVAAGVNTNAYNQSIQQANTIAGAEQATQGSNYNARMAAAQMLAGLGSQGFGLISGGADLGLSGAQAGLGFGTSLQDLQNQQITGQMQAWNAPLDLYQQLAAVLQGRSWGSTTTGSSKTTSGNVGVSNGPGG